MSIAFRVLILTLLSFGAIWVHHTQFSSEDWTPTALGGAGRSFAERQSNPVDEIIPRDELATAVLWQRSRIGSTATGGNDFAARSRAPESPPLRPPAAEEPLVEGVGTPWDLLPGDGAHPDEVAPHGDLPDGSGGEAQGNDAPPDAPPAPPAPPDPPQRPGIDPVTGLEEIVYTVERGDSAWVLAKRFLGDGRRYEELVAANPGKFGRDGALREGTELRILVPAPPPEMLKGDAGADDSTVEERSAPPPEAPADNRGERSHPVARNENLTSIAQRYYPGVPDGWRRLFEANRDRIQSPDLVPEGTVLKIPVLSRPGSSR